MKLRRQPMTQERLRKVGHSYRYMFLLTQLLELEYAQWCDSDFNNPTIHNKIRKMNEAKRDVVRHFGSFVDNKSIDAILEPTHYLNETVKILCSLEADQIAEFAQGLTKMINDGK